MRRRRDSRVACSISYALLTEDAQTHSKTGGKHFATRERRLSRCANWVTHRQFKDRQGKVWDVWQVHPTALERRFSQRRVKDEERVDAVERRSEVERRADKLSRSPVAPEFAYGWLCFETTGEKRRLAPVPEGWERADDETIEQWCCVAKPVLRRPSGSIGGAQKLP